MERPYKDYSARERVAWEFREIPSRKIRKPSSRHYQYRKVKGLGVQGLGIRA